MRTSELLDSYSDSILQKQITNMLLKLLDKKQPAQYFDFQNMKITVPLPNKQMYTLQAKESLFFL